MNNTGYGAPISYDYLNVMTSQESPSTLHANNNRLQYFFARYLLQKAISVFKWEMPKEWSRDYFLYSLYSWGYVSIVNTDKFGVIPQGCGLRGYDIFYRPSHAIIVNPLLQGILEPRIDVECVLFKLTPDYKGIMDMVNYYADLMALASESMTMNLSNSKLSYVFTSDNKGAAESFKKMFDQINEGNPAVFVDKDLFKDDGSKNWEAFEQNVGQNYIVDRILADIRKIENMFNTAIGVPNANTDKKERLLVDEVNANNEETNSLCELWLEELKKACTSANTMFGISLSVDWRNKPEEAKEVSPNASKS